MVFEGTGGVVRNLLNSFPNRYAAGLSRLPANFLTILPDGLSRRIVPSAGGGAIYPVARVRPAGGGKARRRDEGPRRQIHPTLCTFQDREGKQLLSPFMFFDVMIGLVHGIEHRTARSRICVKIVQA